MLLEIIVISILIYSLFKLLFGGDSKEKIITFITDKIKLLLYANSSEILILYQENQNEINKLIQSGDTNKISEKQQEFKENIHNLTKKNIEEIDKGVKEYFLDNKKD